LIGVICTNQVRILVDPKGSKGAAVANGAIVETKNSINMEMEGLTEEDRKEVEHELEMEMVEIQRKKLVCFQKTRNGVVKKSDTMAASGSKVNAQVSPEDLVHMVDVSVASKYMADLT
jgi:hypothetical protein